MLQLPAALCSRRFRPCGAAQTIKPQTGRNASQRDPGQRGRSVKDVPRRSQAPPLRAQAPAHFVPADAKHAVPVVGVGVIAQKEQKIPHWTAVCHSRCCCCQRCQPYRPPTLRIIISVSVTGFHQGSHVLCSWRRVCRGDWPGATTENSFPGQIRKKLCILDRRTFFANVYPTSPTATTCARGR